MSAEEVEIEVEVEPEIEVELEIEVDAEEDTTEKKPAKKEQPRERLEDLKPVDAPNQAEYEQNKAAAQAKLDEVLALMAGLTQKIDVLVKERTSAGDTRRSIQDKQAELKSQRTEAFDKSDKAQEQLEQIEKERAEKRAALAQHRQGLKFTKVEDLDNAVNKIQLKLTTAGLPREVQQKLLADLNSLKSQRQKVVTYSAMLKLVSAEKQDTTPITKQLDQDSRTTRDIRQLERKLQQEFTECRKKENQVRKEIDVLIKERKSLGKNKYTYNNEVYKIERDYQNKLYNYTRYVEKVKYLKRVKAREERAARDAAWKEENATPEEVMEKIPYAAELQTCDDLTRYLAALLPRSASAAKEAPTEEDSKVVEIAASRNAGFKGKKSNAVLAKEDKIGEEWVSAAREAFGQKKRRVRKKKDKAIINHIPDIFSKFKKIGVEPPLLRSNIEATLESLAEKKNYYETAPPPEKKEKKAAAKPAVKPTEEEDVAAENKTRSRNRRASIQAQDTEQARRVSEAAEASNAAATEAAAERRASIQMASAAVEEEQARRVAEEQGHQQAEKAERKENQRRASLMLDEEQQRRIAEYEEKKAAEKAQPKKKAAAGSGGDALTDMLAAAEKARTGKGGASEGKSKKSGNKEPQSSGDALTDMLQAAEKARK